MALALQQLTMRGEKFRLIVRRQCIFSSCWSKYTGLTEIQHFVYPRKQAATLPELGHHAANDIVKFAIMQVALIISKYKNLSLLICIYFKSFQFLLLVCNYG